MAGDGGCTPRMWDAAQRPPMRALIQRRGLVRYLGMHTTSDPPRPAPVPPHATATTLTARLRTYAAHDDPATTVANAIALIVGWNGPFYPLYVVALAGAGVGPAVALTALSTPFFLAIPALARRSSRVIVRNQP